MTRSYSRGLSASLLALVLCHCGPRHEGGGGSAGSSSSGSGGDAGEGPSGGIAGVGGAATAGVGGSSTAGKPAGGSSAAGSPAGGSSTAGNPAGGSAALPTDPADEAVIGCEATTWPDEGFFFEAPPPTSSSSHSATLLGTFTPDGISGDGKLVVGHADDLPVSRATPLTWSVSGGVTQPWPSAGSYTYAMQASCDGSAVLVQTSTFDLAYRFLAGHDPAEAVQVLNGATPPGAFLPANPDLSVVFNSFGASSDDGPVPLRWSLANGFEVYGELTGSNVYGVGPDGTVLAGDEDVLFLYDPSTQAKTTVGVSPVDLGHGWHTFRASADGKAWVQSADLHHDSFLVGRGGVETRSVTCPNPCRLRDLSGTGLVALLDVQFVPDVSSSSSWIWSEKTGLVDLTSLFEQSGFDFHGRKLIASAMSDDGRAFAGNLYDPNTYIEYPPFFYGVLPASVYEAPTVPPTLCASDADCEPTSACEAVTCLGGRCVAGPAATDITCEDGLFCTNDQHCDGHGACGPGTSPCNEYVPGIPRCNEALRQCEICTDGRALVNGECRCPYWNCLARGGATYCSETDVSEENQVGCFYDGLTVDDLEPLPENNATDG